MNFIIILTGLLCFRVQYGTGLKVYCEGREAALRFSFTRRDIDVTLQFGNRIPFYSNHGGIGQMLESGLYKDQINRFQVKQNDTDNHYNIILIISNVSRGDEGTYISLAYIDREMVPDLTIRIALVVEYPPGNPHCRYVSPSYIDVIRNTWDIIECTADIGTMLGYIVCFQNNEILPVHGNLVKNSTTLSQRIWVKKGQLISCCSPDYRGLVLVDASSCTAFQMGKVEGRPTTTSATSSSRGSSSYLTHDMATPFSEYYTTSSMFDNVNDISSYKIFVTEVLILTTIGLVLLITMMLLFIQLMKTERRIKELFLAFDKNCPEFQLENYTDIPCRKCVSKEAHSYKIEDFINNYHIAINMLKEQHDIIHRYMVDKDGNQGNKHEEQRSPIIKGIEVIQQQLKKMLHRHSLQEI